jgi:putative transposase
MLNQVEAGRTVKEVARELAVSEATIYTWKGQVRRHGMEDENRRLKQGP